MKTSFYFGIVLLSGCASMFDPSKMTAEQLKAVAADNKGVAYCMQAQNAAGNVRGVFANLDLVNKVEGSVTLDPDCKLTINSKILQPGQTSVSASAASATK